MQKISIFAMHLNHGGIEKYISHFCEMFHNDYNIELIVTYKDVENPIYKIPSNVNIFYLVNDSLYKISNKKLLKKGKILSIVKEIIRRNKLKKLAIKRNIEAINNLETDFILTTRIYHNNLINKHYQGNAIRIATEHNYHNNDLKYINRFVSSVSNFDYTIHCTNELYEFYKDKIIGPKNIFIPNAISLKNDVVSSLNNKNIISVGRLSSEKGFLDLIEIMKIVVSNDNQIHLTICGDGYQYGEIKQKIREYNLDDNIELTGFLNTNQLREKYLNSSLYVMCSKSESFGLVLLESMHYGLPCIAFDSASGARELLSNNIGLLVKDRNKEAMADIIVKLINSKKDLKKYQKFGLNKVKDYSLDKIKKEWKDNVFKGD